DVSEDVSDVPARDCSSIASIEPTEGWELITVGDNLFDWFTLSWPPLQQGCVTYAPKLEFRTTDLLRGRYTIDICHTCEEPQELQWLSFIRDGEDDLLEVSAVGLFSTVRLRSNDAVLPLGCPTSRSYAMCGGRDSVTRRSMSIPPGEVVSISNRTLEVRGFNHFIHYGGDGEQLEPETPAYPYWDNPVDYTGDLQLEALLPRLWPANTPVEQIQPDMSGEIACLSAGLPLD